jgi:RNA polymerase primary sigma factor
MGISANLIATINKLVRTSQLLLRESGRQPTHAELATRLAMPVEKVQRLLKIADGPISLQSLTQPR